MTIDEALHNLVVLEMKTRDPSDRKTLFMAMASMKALKEFKERLEVLEYQHIEGYKLPLYKNEEVWAILEDVAGDIFEDLRE